MTAASSNETQARFGDAVRARRLELNLTQDDVVDLDGPSLGTQRSIENAHAASYQSKTLQSIDRVLRWKPGTSSKLLRGELVALESVEVPSSSLGSLLREGRKAAGLSIRAAARSAGFSEGRWRQLEAGYEVRSGVQVPVNTTASTVVQAAGAVAVDADEALHAAGIEGVDPEAVRGAGQGSGEAQKSPPEGAIDSLIWSVRTASIADLRRLRDVVDTALAIRTEGGQ
ncbi:helix-turn-helix domain-containing protein [Amycolatopsis speibonae]|uniref:Helix-turn-helix domain-containing protein n=1 Tax=Amycolatopsis speibonae TaxID=1450224 RepID=A0ABV7P798_9PSEU